MTPPSGRGGLDVQVDTSQWQQMIRDLKQFDPKLATALRKRLRNSGNWAVDRIRKNLELPSPDGGPDTGDMRALLSAATKVTLSFSAKNAGVKVTTSGAQVPKDRRGILKAYNLKEFRHPVFGDKETWIAQRGRPYFVQAFDAELQKLTRQEINAALEEAIAVLDRR
jgi:hypothetical protein